MPQRLVSEAELAALLDGLPPDDPPTPAPRMPAWAWATVAACCAQVASAGVVVWLVWGRC